jgi:hypothetical protein
VSKTGYKTISLRNEEIDSLRSIADITLSPLGIIATPAATIRYLINYYMVDTNHAKRFTSNTKEQES